MTETFSLRGDFSSLEDGLAVVPICGYKRERDLDTRKRKKVRKAGSLFFAVFGLLHTRLSKIIIVHYFLWCFALEKEKYCTSNDVNKKNSPWERLETPVRRSRPWSILAPSSASALTRRQSSQTCQLPGGGSPPTCGSWTLSSRKHWRVPGEPRQLLVIGSYICNVDTCSTYWKDPFNLWKREKHCPFDSTYVGRLHYIGAARPHWVWHSWHWF